MFKHDHMPPELRRDIEALIGHEAFRAVGDDGDKLLKRVAQAAALQGAPVTEGAKTCLKAAVESVIFRFIEAVFNRPARADEITDHDVLRVARTNPELNAPSNRFPPAKSDQEVADMASRPFAGMTLDVSCANEPPLQRGGQRRSFADALAKELRTTRRKQESPKKRKKQDENPQ